MRKQDKADMGLDRVLEDRPRVVPVEQRRLAEEKMCIRDSKETFFDGKVFDPANPSAYLASLSIKRVA